MMLCNNLLIDGVNVTVESSAPWSNYTNPMPIHIQQTTWRQLLAAGGVAEGMYPQTIVITQP